MTDEEWFERLLEKIRILKRSQKKADLTIYFGRFKEGQPRIVVQEWGL